MSIMPSSSNSDTPLTVDWVNTFGEDFGFGAFHPAFSPTLSACPIDRDQPLIEKGHKNRVSPTTRSALRSGDLSHGGSARSLSSATIDYTQKGSRSLQDHSDSNSAHGTFEFQEQLQMRQDVADWLEMTAYHDVAYREKALTRFRRKKDLEREKAALEKEERQEWQDRLRLGHSISMAPFPSLSSSATVARALTENGKVVGFPAKDLAGPSPAQMLIDGYSENPTVRKRKYHEGLRLSNVQGLTMAPEMQNDSPTDSKYSRRRRRRSPPLNSDLFRARRSSIPRGSRQSTASRGRRSRSPTPCRRRSRRPTPPSSWSRSNDLYRPSHASYGTHSRSRDRRDGRYSSPEPDCRGKRAKIRDYGQQLDY